MSPKVTLFFSQMLVAPLRSLWLLINHHFCMTEDSGAALTRWLFWPPSLSTVCKTRPMKSSQRHVFVNSIPKGIVFNRLKGSFSVASKANLALFDRCASHSFRWATDSQSDEPRGRALSLSLPSLGDSCFRRRRRRTSSSLFGGAASNGDRPMTPAACRHWLGPGREAGRKDGTGRFPDLSPLIIIPAPIVSPLDSDFFGLFGRAANLEGVWWIGKRGLLRRRLWRGDICVDLIGGIKPRERFELNSHRPNALNAKQGPDINDDILAILWPPWSDLERKREKQSFVGN